MSVHAVLWDITVHTQPPAAEEWQPGLVSMYMTLLNAPFFLTLGQKALLRLTSPRLRSLFVFTTQPL